MLRRIEAERYHQRTRSKRADGLFCEPKRLNVAVVPGADRQRNVEIGTEPGTRAPLMRITPDEGVEEGRAGLDRNRQNFGPLVEDALGAVAVVDIDVEDRHALMFQAQMGGRDRAVVEKAKAAGEVAIGGMTGRTAGRVN